MFAAFAAAAQEWKEAEPIHKSANEEWKKEALKDGVNSHDGRIAEFGVTESFTNLWSYWYIQSGDKPENFKLAPLKFSAVKSKSWNSPYWEVPGAAGLPAVIGIYGYITQTSAAQGMGIAFRNPYPHAVSVAVEGNFGYYPTPKPYQMYLFTRTSDGQIKILKSSLEPGAIYLIEGKKKDGSPAPRHYFRLGVDCRLSRGAMIYLMIYDPSVTVGDRRAGKWEIRFCLDQGQGTIYRPTFIITDSSNKQGEK